MDWISCRPNIYNGCVKSNKPNYGHIYGLNHAKILLSIYLGKEKKKTLYMPPLNGIVLDINVIGKDCHSWIFLFKASLNWKKNKKLTLLEFWSAKREKIIILGHIW